MTPSQLKRRQALLDRSDAALERWPERVAEPFLCEMSEVARGLETLAREADAEDGDRFERCRTWRFAGNACFDLGNGKELPQMRRAVSAFEKAELLLEGLDNPIERMKLNYSFGHALFHLSDATDVTLVQKARDCYRIALILARRHLPVAVESAQKALTAAEQLLATMQTISQLDTRKSEIERQLRGLDAENSGARQPGEWRDDLKNLFGELQNVYQKDVAGGKVSSARQQALNPVLATLGSMVGQRPTSLADLSTESARLRELMARVAPLLGQTSQPVRAAVLRSGSRAQAVWSRFAVVKKDLASDIARPHSGSDERDLGMDLFLRCGHADTLVHQHVDDEAWILEYERDVLRQLGADVRAHALRYHLVLARPIWPSTPITPDPNAVFYSGAPDLQTVLAEACNRLGLTLLTSPSGRVPKDYAAARWDQCRTGQIAIFDYTHYRPPSSLKSVELRAAGPVASVSYDLGMAVTLGRPVVIIANEGQELPFDVGVEPVRLRNRSLRNAKDQARLAEALDDAMYSSRAGSSESSLPESRGYLQERFGKDPNVVVSQSARLLDEQSTRDPVAFRRFVDLLIGAAGKEAPLLVFPVWPGSYPPALKPNLFHVTPFGPRWAADTMRVTAEACARKSPRVDYIRGDQVLDPNIIRSIWDHLCQASYVLVDLTSLNANVAFELAIAHVLGRNALLVSQDENLNGYFPAIAKTRVHRYGLSQASGASTLDGLVRRFLAEAGSQQL